MKAVVCHQAALEVVERPEPTPGRGQVRLRVVRCGICGSDLHARHGLDDWADMAAEAGYDRSTEQVVFGHEFSGEVAEYGPGCRKDVPTGAPVVALPLIRGDRGVDTVGLSPRTRPARTPSSCSRRSRSCCRCPTASRRRWRR